MRFRCFDASSWKISVSGQQHLRMFRASEHRFLTSARCLSVRPGLAELYRELIF